MISDKHDKENAEKIFCSLTAIGNCILLIALTVLFVLCSLDIYNPWEASLKNPILISKAWFQVIFWSLLPMFVAATLPILILLRFKK
jgi:hypothetical protein